jgi:hypothetical protein
MRPAAASSRIASCRSEAPSTPLAAAPAARSAPWARLTAAAASEGGSGGRYVTRRDTPEADAEAAATVKSRGWSWAMEPAG